EPGIGMGQPGGRAAQRSGRRRPDPASPLRLSGAVSRSPSGATPNRAARSSRGTLTGTAVGCRVHCPVSTRRAGRDWLDKISRGETVMARKQRDVLSVEWVKLELIRTAYATRGGLFSVMDPRMVLGWRSAEHTSELQSRFDLDCRLLLEKKNDNQLGQASVREPG